MLSARFVMPAVVLPTSHCIAAAAATTTTTLTKSHSVANTNAAQATCTTTFYWLPVVDSPARCYCRYCGGRLLFGNDCANSTTGAPGSVVAVRASSFVDECSPPPPPPFPSRDFFNRFCRCDGAVANAAAAVVLLVPYVLGPPCFRPIVLPPAFVAAANHLRHHRRRIHHLQQYHHLYNTAVNMETR